MAEKNSGKDKLKLWQERYQSAKSRYQAELDLMDKREKRYDGDHVIYGPDGKSAGEALHVRNVVAEMIETQVDSAILQPKVTAVHEEDEELARVIENMLRCKLKTLPMAKLIDQAERTCPLQGGVGILPEWDEDLGGHTELGDIRLTLLHPKKIIPQPRRYEIEEMDWHFITAERTKNYIKRRYGVDVSDETEDEPEIREVDGATAEDDLVTQIYAYYRNESGRVGLYSWVGDTVLVDKPDFRMRQLHTCKTCGEIGDGIRCHYCGSKKFSTRMVDSEVLTETLARHIMPDIPATPMGMASVQSFPTGEMLLQQPGGFSAVHVTAETGVRLPYYTPTHYPLILRKNISRYGRFLGGSDADAMEDAQNTLNKLLTRKQQKILGGGSILIKPADLAIKLTDEQYRVVEVTKPQDVNMIGVKTLQVDTSADAAAVGETYEEARQIVGVTDSLQGRRDPTATSMVAKQFSAAQAAGRMQSKKAMKEDFFCDLFRSVFELMLAYADEPRPIRIEGEDGQTEYMMFDRHDFLKQDAAGEWYYEDDFIFECDASATLAQDREKLWQENRANYENGAYGDRNDPRTLLIFWREMEKLNYPLAATAIKAIESMIEEQEAQATKIPTVMPGAEGQGMETLPGMDVNTLPDLSGGMA